MGCHKRTNFSCERHYLNQGSSMKETQSTKLSHAQEEPEAGAGRNNLNQLKVFSIKSAKAWRFWRWEVDSKVCTKIATILHTQLWEHDLLLKKHPGEITSHGKKGLVATKESRWHARYAQCFGCHWPKYKALSKRRKPSCWTFLKAWKQFKASKFSRWNPRYPLYSTKMH